MAVLLKPRRALAVAQRRLRLGRVLIVNGPRQSGKTSLLQVLHTETGGDYLTLDDARSLRPARLDPAGFVREAARPTMIDEVQRGGNQLVLAVKSEVDRDPSPGQFVLAGSTRFLLEPRLSESLAGRALFVDLWPFSQGEVDERGDEDFVSVLFGGPDALLARRVAGESRGDTFERVCRGGMPAGVGFAGRDRREFLQAYIRALASRDIAEMGSTRHGIEITTVMRALTGRTAQEMNTAKLSSALGVSVDVLRPIVERLENIYFHYRLPAWSRNLTSKVVRKPKVHLVDSGVAAVLLGVDAERLRRPGEVLSGPLLETFVAGEISRQLTWSETEASVHHWRNRDGAEVDLVLERPTGEIAGIEVKASLDFGTSDLNGLRILRDRLGDAFVAGVLLHCGDRVQFVEDKLIAMPIGALWSDG